MPVLIRFVLVNFIAGAALGAGLAMWLIAAEVGPGALIAGAPEPALAAAMFAYSIGAAFGLGYLATALAWASRDGS